MAEIAESDFGGWKYASRVKSDDRLAFWDLNLDRMEMKGAGLGWFLSWDCLSLYPSAPALRPPVLFYYSLSFHAGRYILTELSWQYSITKVMI